ncbi:CD225/dispanin family protein [Nocardiopsis sp. FIRDI 009]|uniref:CD225/dispanin family protein n=1 Tax=Nocardiopsis sp. FIRDI 009 TaxID=714197 RepID=UPI000E2236CD|nr:CD225/dispanin family protein [Nocardiopsis sp. FIRDI 009]
MSYGPPPHGGYGTGGYGATPPSAEPPKNYLVHNILGILSCLPPVGIIGLIFALQINSKWQMGDYAGAQESAKVAKTMGIISLVAFILGIVGIVLYILFIVVMIGVAATAPTY